ncbi:DMT family transporter [Acidiplasma cupricumulans]|uniref:DMT family transporter n=1 Tax=Acidiplasma cupricumulans TaxID=312540 RepID=UPI00191C5C28|nr:DMT family transporter [Acidiplasma cupricumulans]
MQNFSGIKFLIPLVVIWGFTYPFTKEISVYVSPLIISCSRIGISTIFFLFMARGYVFGKKEMIAGLLNIFAFLTLLNLGISESNNPGLASVMIYTQPIFVIIFEMLLGYRPARRIILGIIIAFAGVSLSITSVKFDIGIIIALIAAIFWAGGTVFYSRNLKNANVLKLNAFYGLNIISIFNIHNAI